MKLIYRGQTFTANPNAVTYQPPFAINWRYQVAGGNYQQDYSATVPYYQPKAINWRWQVPT